VCTLTTQYAEGILAPKSWPGCVPVHACSAKKRSVSTPAAVRTRLPREMTASDGRRVLSAWFSAASEALTFSVSSSTVRTAASTGVNTAFQILVFRKKKQSWSATVRLGVHPPCPFCSWIWSIQVVRSH
jgi:hypothetical protein